VAQTGVSDEVYQAVREVFAEKELVDLTIAISLMNAYNRMAISFRNIREKSVFSFPPGSLTVSPADPETVMSERGKTRSRAPGANSNAAIAANNNTKPAIALQRVTRSTLMPASHGPDKDRNAFDVPATELFPVPQSETRSR
jgi:hypothetical protein